jgi:hypothetical protein
MVSDLPNTTESGGNSPKEWTKELTEFVVGIGILLRLAPLPPVDVHPESQIGQALGYRCDYHFNVDDSMT